MARCRLLPASRHGGVPQWPPALIPGSGTEPRNQFAILNFFPSEANIAAASGSPVYPFKLKEQRS